MDYQALVEQKTFQLENPAVFRLLEVKGSILVEKGSSLVAIVQRGSILDDSRLNPLCFVLNNQQQLLCKNNLEIAMPAWK